jgi:hypothetical protein
VPPLSRNFRADMRLTIAIFVCILSSPAFAGYDLHITRKPHWTDDNGPLDSCVHLDYAIDESLYK